jgi:hypothetical protein
MTPRELGRMLQRMADEEPGGQGALAARLGVTRGFLNDVIHGRKRAGRKLLHGLGLEALTVYASKPPARRRVTA